MPRLPALGWIKRCITCEQPTACAMIIKEISNPMPQCRKCSKRIGATEVHKHLFEITRAALCK